MTGPLLRHPPSAKSEVIRMLPVDLVQHRRRPAPVREPEQPSPNELEQQYWVACGEDDDPVRC